MVAPAEADIWRPRLASGAGPLYLKIVDALAAGVRSGELRPGDRLPPQRSLAATLGVDLTTVTRAYAEARRRELIDAVTGRGSFVAARREPDGPRVDLSMNVPPAPRGVRLGEQVARGVADVVARQNVEQLMSYHSGPGEPADRAAGAAWLRPVLGRLDPNRIAITPGAQSALAAIVSLHAAPGGVILSDELVYPGLLSAAARFAQQVVPVAGDADGMRPDALEAGLRARLARLVYLAPTLNNPTTRTMPEARRREILRVAEAEGAFVVEDDPYSLLAGDAPPAFVTLEPSRVWHVATVSKTLSPGLRTAYALPPDETARQAFVRASRALAQMPAPLMTALLTFWIRDGAAGDILAGVREEAAARQRIARAILPAQASAHPNGLHVWLPLSPSRDRRRLVDAARAEGLGVAPSDAFSAGDAAPDAIRISLGAVSDKTRLTAALKTLAGLIAEDAPRFHDLV